MAETLVELDDLHVHFRAGRGRVARAVDGVSLDIHRGEVLALVGESGCGKTTIARSILGLVAPASGEVSVQQQRATVPSELKAVRRRTGFVLQDPTGALNPRRTVFEAVREGLAVHRVPGDHRQIVADTLARCGLRPAERFIDLYPHQLSGGQRQRVVIAGAMALQPDLLIADEPVSSLDASVRGEILALLLDLVRTEGVTVLVITHDLGLAWNIADRVAVMYLGRIVELGTADEILSAPRHPYTRALLSVVPEHRRMDQQILSGEIPDPTRIPPGCRFHPRCPVLQSGEAERLGVAERCRTDDPQLEGGCACWAVR